MAMKPVKETIHAKGFENAYIRMILKMNLYR